jgi:hypothetical protein
MYIFLVFSQQMCTDTKTWCSTYTLPKLWQKMQHLYITKTVTENATLIHYQNLDRKCSTYTLPKPWQKMQHLYITKTVTENATLIHYQNRDRKCNTYTLPKPWQTMPTPTKSCWEPATILFPNSPYLLWTSFLIYLNVTILFVFFFHVVFC